MHEKQAGFQVQIYIFSVWQEVYCVFLTKYYLLAIWGGIIGRSVQWFLRSYRLIDHIELYFN